MKIPIKIIATENKLGKHFAQIKNPGRTEVLPEATSHVNSLLILSKARPKE